MNPSLSRVFITIQYTACIVLVIFAIVIARQVEFVYNKDLGFDKEQTMIITNPYWGDKEKTMAFRERLYRYVDAQPSMSGVTGTTFRFGNGLNMNGHYLNGKHEMIGEIKVDYDYFALNKIAIVKGREFSRDFALDTSRLILDKEYQDTAGSKTMSNLIVNETLYDMLGRPPLNEPVKSLAGVIVGVCKDYFYTGLQQKIGPLYHECRPNRLGYFWLRLAANQNVASVIRNVKSKYDEITNHEPFSYTFMDEDVKTAYESHARWLKVISAASWMAIIIACLGLFGLSAIAAVNRTKEIGIRKVLGASALDLFMTLNKQTVLLIVLSICMAVPVALYISKSWLENFAY
ncbi:MAG TPA: FtsX-like permease family protein, partial [Flavisolibacter sp.]|nr:FtsX-like permease family protein [Flavisolibacter sp.]